MSMTNPPNNLWRYGYYEKNVHIHHIISSYSPALCPLQCGGMSFHCWTNVWSEQRTTESTSYFQYIYSVTHVNHKTKYWKGVKHFLTEPICVLMCICRLQHLYLYESQPVSRLSCCSKPDRGKLAGGGCYGNSGRGVMLSLSSSDAMSREVVVVVGGWGWGLMAGAGPVLAGIRACTAGYCSSAAAHHSLLCY